MNHLFPSEAAASPAEPFAPIQAWPRLRAAGLAVAASLVLAACGGGGDSTETTAAAAAPVSSDPESTATTAATTTSGATDFSVGLATDPGADASAGHSANIASEPPADVAGEAFASSAGTTLAGAPADPAPAVDPVPAGSGASDSSASPSASTLDTPDTLSQTATASDSKTVGMAGPIVVIDPGYLTRFSAGEYLKAATTAQTDNLMGVAAIASRVDPVTGGTYSVDPGLLNVHYEEGSLSERSASIVTDPANASNKALQFMLKSANVRDSAGVPIKGRVQMNAYVVDQVRAKEIRFTTRMKLSSDIELLRSMTKTFDWLTISEWWNNAGWTDEPYPFRVSVNVTKPLAAAGSALRFQAKAQVLDLATNKWNTTLWSATNSTIEVPTGKWVTLEYHFRQGNATEGRFYLAIVPDGGVRQVVFDVTGWTQHPADPAPDGLSHLNPLKLYTSSAILDHMRAAGGTMSVLWDDLGFRLCAQRYTRGSSPCGPETWK